MYVDGRQVRTPEWRHTMEKESGEQTNERTTPGPTSSSTRHSGNVQTSEIAFTTALAPGFLNWMHLISRTTTLERERSPRHVKIQLELVCCKTQRKTRAKERYCCGDELRQQGHAYFFATAHTNQTNGMIHTPTPQTDLFRMHACIHSHCRVNVFLTLGAWESLGTADQDTDDVRSSDLRDELPRKTCKYA